MTATEQNSREVKTVEEYSLYSLDRSVEGLDFIKEDALACCREIEQNDLYSSLKQLITLTSHLHSFNTFEQEMSTLFSLNTEAIRDRKGSLADTENLFRATLEKLGKLIELHQFRDIPGLIRESMIPFLNRFQELIPVLKNHITTEYINA